jgi:hypothetical protein
MTTTAQLAITLSTEFPACPLATIRDMIRWAQRTLCYEGNIWVVRDAPCVTAADTDYAELEAPATGEAVTVMGLLDENGRGYKPGIDYIQLSPTEIEFRTKPKTKVIWGQMICRPKIGLDMPAELITRWSESLMDGARYKLLLLPQPWKDPQLADFYNRKFLDQQSAARDQAQNGYQYGSVRAKTRPFA